MAWLGQQRGRQSTGKARVSFAEVEEGTAPLRISMYDEAPQGEVAIEEFERFALDRLKGMSACWHRYQLQRSLTQQLS